MKEDEKLTIEDEMKDGGMILEFLPRGHGRVLIKRPHRQTVRLYISEVHQHFSKRFTVDWDEKSQKIRAIINGTEQKFSGPSLLAVLDEVRSFK